MLLSQSCHSLVCAFSSCFEWGDPEQNKKKPAHCVREETHFPRQLFHQKRLRLVMTAVSIGSNTNHERHFFACYNNLEPRQTLSQVVPFTLDFSLLFPFTPQAKEKILQVIIESDMSSTCYSSFSLGLPSHFFLEDLIMARRNGIIALKQSAYFSGVFDKAEQNGCLLFVLIE